jgi:peroxiredoxin Q/BCP
MISMRLTIQLSLLAILLGSASAVATAQESSGKLTVRIEGGPNVGRRAPDFSLPWANRDGIGPVESPYQLASDRGKTVVVAFYPRDFTKGCTAEMQTLAQQYDSLIGPDAVLVAISSDSVSTHQRFAASLGLPFKLLSDPDQRVSKQYASKDQGGYNRRTVYVVGPDGKVKYRNLKFNALDPQAYADLRAAVKDNTSGT